MTEIWWVRHGPTHRKEMIGWTDAPADLSDTKALARLAAYLPDAPVVSSDLSRAVATADAIQGARPRLAHLPSLRELNFGAWEGRSATELFEEDPKVMEAYWNDPAGIRPPGGVILTQIHRARGGEVKDVLAERIENLSVTELRLGPTGWDAGRINHLP